MKRILLCLFLTTASAGLLRAQESAAEQRINELSGRLETLIERQAAQDKRLDMIAKEISELREQANKPQANDYANRDELNRLAKSVSELAGNQQADKEKILESLKKLGQTIADAPVNSGKKKKNSAPKMDNETKPAAKTDEPPKSDVTGYPYKVQPGDTLSVIVKAYHDKGVKVTTAQVLKANPGLDADKLFVGKTIIIPDPTAK